jgi:dynein heavy chain, axonemal
MRETILVPSMKFLRNEMVEFVDSSDGHVIASFFRILDAMLQPYVHTTSYEVPSELKTGMDDVMPHLFLFATIWSVGGTCDGPSRMKFDAFLRENMKASNDELWKEAFPSEGLVYDYCYTHEVYVDEDAFTLEYHVPEHFREWVNWSDQSDDFHVNLNSSFVDIKVPTMDSLRSEYMLRLLLTRGHHVLCVGPTGTGKSVSINDVLLNQLPQAVQPIFIAFSAHTSANQVQDTLDARFEKRRKGVYGPPLQQRYVVFVDDMNLPAVEEFGAQPPVELLRQFVDQGGWYNRKKLDFHQIVDSSLISAIGPPGGGRNRLTNRIVRHMNIISFPDMDDVSVKRIFSSILDAFLEAHFPVDIVALSLPVVDASVEVYNSVRKDLLPTPLKSHYTFNLRDLAAVFQGILNARPSTVTGSEDLVRLWVHECEVREISIAFVFSSFLFSFQ